MAVKFQDMINAGNILKLAVILAILLIIIVGCLMLLPSGPKINGIQELVLNETDLQQLGMASDGPDCLSSIDESQTTISGSPLLQYTMCNYTINSLNDTQVIIQLQKFTNREDLDGTYQYASSHLYSVQGLISENDFGDQSRFRVNNVNDYGGQYDPPGVYYYHLWICKDVYLIHITSSGRSEGARESVANIGRRILSKFSK